MGEGPVSYHVTSDRKDGGKDDRKGLVVCGCTEPRTTKRANIPGNLPCISS